MTGVHDWDELRAELDDGDGESLAAERARTEAWIRDFRLADEAKNGDLDANEVTASTRQSAGARLWIMQDYGAGGLSGSTSFVGP